MAHLCRIDHRQRQAGPGEGGSRHCFEAAGCLKGHQHRQERAQPGDQLLKTRAATLYGKGFSQGMHMHIEPILRDINADIDLFHGYPALLNRARQAARATGRGHAHDGRGTRLPRGLHAPRLCRSPLRHRTSNHSRCGTTLLTRLPPGGRSPHTPKQQLRVRGT